MVQENKLIGVYAIINIKSNKCYIGSSKYIAARLKGHLKALELNNHYNTYFQKAWNKHGEINFICTILEFCPIKKLAEREQYWLDETLCYNHKYGYNMLSIAYHCDPTKETKEKTRGKNNGSYVHVSQEKINKIIYLYCNKNLLLNEIELKVNIKAYIISRILKENNIRTRSKKETAILSKKKFRGKNNGSYVHVSQQEINKIIYLYCNKKLTQRKVVFLTGYTKWIVSRVLKENNIIIRSVTETIKASKALKDSNSGKSKKAKQLGIKVIDWNDLEDLL